MTALIKLPLSLWLLYYQLGASLFVGFGVMVMVIPITAIISIKQKKIQKEQMAFKDQRIKVTSEVVSGIKVSSYCKNVLEHIMLFVSMRVIFPYFH